MSNVVSDIWGECERAPQECEVYSHNSLDCTHRKYTSCSYSANKISMCVNSTFEKLLCVHSPERIFEVIVQEHTREERLDSKQNNGESRRLTFNMRGQAVERCP